MKRFMKEVPKYSSGIEIKYKGTSYNISPKCVQLLEDSIMSGMEGNNFGHDDFFYRVVEYLEEFFGLSYGEAIELTKEAEWYLKGEIYSPIKPEDFCKEYD